MHGPTIRQVKAGDDDWTLMARCRGCDPDLFFPERKSGNGSGRSKELRRQLQEATAVCAECPVIVQCYSRAITYRVTDGVWGGVWFGNSYVRSEAYNLEKMRQRGLAKVPS